MHLDDTTNIHLDQGPISCIGPRGGTAQVRVLIGCVFVEIVTELEIYHICRAVLLTI